MPIEVLVLDMLSRVEGVAHGFGTRAGAPTEPTGATLQQVHSARVLRADAPGCVGEGDALITRTPGLRISVRTADCYPILLVDERTRAIAAIHAGWRGTAGRIVSATVEKMRAQFGTNPEDLIAGIGPGIGVCGYEVGDEVARRFGSRGRSKIDLAWANREQLIEAGMRPDRIGCVERCTFCEAQVFESYRRDGKRAGRMISFIELGTAG